MFKEDMLAFLQHICIKNTSPPSLRTIIVNSQAAGILRNEVLSALLTPAAGSSSTYKSQVEKNRDHSPNIPTMALLKKKLSLPLSLAQIALYINVLVHSAQKLPQHSSSPLLHCGQSKPESGLWCVSSKQTMNSNQGL